MGAAALAVLAACDGGGNTSEAGSPGADERSVEVTVAGPNHLATLFVESMLAADPAAVSRLCEPGLADFFSNVAKAAEINREITTFLTNLYPDADETERRRLWVFEQWKIPMTSFRNLEIDGRLRVEEGGQRVVYQLAHLNRHSRRTYPELVVEKQAGEWKVISYGPETPGSSHIGLMRTRLARLEEASRVGIAAVKEANPRSLTRAIDVLTENTSADDGDAK